MSLKRKILNYSLGPIGVAIISGITIPILAWYYSVEDIAKFALFQAVIIFYSLVFSFGLDQAFIRNYFDSDNKESLLKSILLGIILPSIVVFIVITPFREVVTKFLYNEYSLLLYVTTLISCFFTLCLKLLTSIQRVNDQAFLFSIGQILPKIIFLILIGFFIFFKDGHFYSIIFSQFLAILLVFLFFLFINKSYILNSFKSNISIVQVNKYYKYGFPLILTGLIIWGLKLADRFYLKYFSDLEQLGLYSMAISIASGAAIFAGIFNTIWSPMVYKWVEGGDVKSNFIARQVENIALKASIAICIIIFISIFVSKFIVFLLPLEYREIYLLIPLCILSALLYTISEITSIGINLMKKTNYTLWSCMGAIFFHLVISFYLIPLKGAVGAAIAGVISFYIFFLLRTYFSNMIWMKNNFIVAHIFIIFSIILACIPVFLGEI